MREERRWIGLLSPFAGIIVAFLICAGLIQVNDGEQQPEHDQHPRVYTPSPPSIVPSDLSSEIARVLRELDVIESRALARWHALKPPILTGQPPVLQNTGTEAIETLGELMLYDKNISPNRNQACASCHMPYAGFVGPIPSVNPTMLPFPATVHFPAGKQTAQRHADSPKCERANPRQNGL